MRRVLDTLRTRFDRILIDMPPVAPLADLHIVAPMADGLLMIVRAGVTPKPAIERALSVVEPDGSTAPGVSYMDEVVGADRCQPGRACDLRAGIETDDAARTVTFHLTKAQPDFLYALALPFAVAVPADTPRQLHPGRFVPATGPYMVSELKPDRIVFSRNPNFRPWPARSDGFADEIDWRLGSDTGRMAAGVLGGGADLTFWNLDPRVVAGLIRNHSGQLVITPAPASWFMTLNTRSAPFDDVLAAFAGLLVKAL